MKLSRLTPGQLAGPEKEGEALADWAETHDAAPAADPTVREFWHLRQARDRRALAALDEARAAAEARANGLSWHQVGLALGITGEAARKRYQKTSSERPAA